MYSGLSAAERALRPQRISALRPPATSALSRFPAALRCAWCGAHKGSKGAVMMRMKNLAARLGLAISMASGSAFAGGYHQICYQGPNTSAGELTAIFGCRADKPNLTCRGGGNCDLRARGRAQA